MSDSDSGGDAPSQQRNVETERALRLAMRQIASEQDVSVPALSREVLCTQVLQEAHSGLLSEVAVWLDPSVGTARATVEALVARHLRLPERSRGDNTTEYAIPNDPSYASLTLEFDEEGLLSEYHYLRR